MSTPGPRRRPIDELFAVLSDPTRRAVLEELVHNGARTATELAHMRPMTRQALAKHLQVLAAAGLVAPERDGREVRYRATTEPLADVVAWLVETSGAWDRRIARLRDGTAAGAPRPPRSGPRAGPR